MSEKLTKDQLEVIRNRSEKATEGPWKSCGNKWGDLVVYSPTIRSGMNNGGEIAEIEFTSTQLDDADFIANARQDIPALLDHITFLNDVISNSRCAECGDELGEDWATNNGVAFCNYCAGLNSL